MCLLPVPSKIPRAAAVAVGHIYLPFDSHVTGRTPFAMTAQNHVEPSRGYRKKSLRDSSVLPTFVSDERQRSAAPLDPLCKPVLHFSFDPSYCTYADPYSAWKLLLSLKLMGRVRYLSRAEAVRLLRDLPEHLAGMALFSMLTGLRQLNAPRAALVASRYRPAVGMGASGRGEGWKGDRDAANAGSCSGCTQAVGEASEVRFTFHGKPVRWVNNTAWHAALERAGIKNFRWHDLRHIWATFHMQAGTPLHVVQQLGGWASPQMTRRYAHLAAGHLAGYVAAFGDRVRLGLYDSATEKEVEAQQ
jgi:hypothetical protein